MDAWAATFPGRESQTGLLRTLLGQDPTHAVPPSLFVWGDSSTGKTSLTRGLLAALEQQGRPPVPVPAPKPPAPRTVVRGKGRRGGPAHAPPKEAPLVDASLPPGPAMPATAFVDCLECHTPSLVFAHILNQLSGTRPSFENGFRGWDRCEYFSEFVRLLKSLRDQREAEAPGPPSRIVIALDKAECLRDSGLLPGFLKLNELTRLNVCVLLLSCLPWEKLESKATAAVTPFLIIHLPVYTGPQMVAILAQDYDFLESLSTTAPPPESSPDPADKDYAITRDLFSVFVHLLYDSFHRNCRDLRELRHMIRLLWPVYKEPVLKRTCTVTNSGKLYRLIVPTFKNALDKLYLRDISSSEWTQTLTTLDSKPNDNEFGLPYYTKFLLIASYLASYNPPKLDVRFFSKGGEDYSKRKGGKTRKVVQGRGKHEFRAQLTGPKSFPVERMLAIFYSIIEDPIDASVDVQMQISTLVSLRLLVRQSSLSQLDAMKCKCNVGIDFVSGFCREIGFDINAYLYDSQ